MSERMEMVERDIRVLVCGGRDFLDKDTGFATLDGIHLAAHISLVIQGGANGADYIAMRWAEDRGVPMQEFRADWRTHGRKAGPIRNQQMLDEGRPNLVIAFPGGRGTADMVRRAKAAGVRVLDAALGGKG